jgi:hypothetical protein
MYSASFPIIFAGIPNKVLINLVNGKEKLM